MTRKQLFWRQMSISEKNMFKGGRPKQMLKDAIRPNGEINPGKLTNFKKKSFFSCVMKIVSYGVNFTLIL